MNLGCPQGLALTPYYEVLELFQLISLRQEELSSSKINSISVSWLYSYCYDYNSTNTPSSLISKFRANPQPNLRLKDPPARLPLILPGAVLANCIQPRKLPAPA